MKKLFSAAFCLGWLAVGLFAQVPVVLAAVKIGDFDYRYGVPSGSNYQQLLKRGEILGSTNDLVQDPVSSERRLAGYGEYHAVYDVPAADYIVVLMDFNDYHRFVPMIVTSEILEQRGTTLISRFRAGISILGFSQVYETISECEYETFPDGSFGVRSRLIDSPDGKMYEHFLSWYIKPVLLDGRQMTYVRYYNRPGIRNPFPGMVTLVRAFANSNLRGQSESIAKETLRRLRK